jgi:hypothetical protein
MFDVVSYEGMAKIVDLGILNFSESKIPLNGGSDVDGDLYMITDGIVDVPYARILIKNKKIKK